MLKLYSDNQFRMKTLSLHVFHVIAFVEGCCLRRTCKTREGERTDSFVGVFLGQPPTQDGLPSSPFCGLLYHCRNGRSPPGGGPLGGKAHNVPRGSHVRLKCCVLAMAKPQRTGFETKLLFTELHVLLASGLRDVLLAALRRHGLPTVTLRDVLFTAQHHAPVFKVVLRFLGDAGL
ncbi:hypothetical protein HPB51_026583 [Rhipicephalus microplus]|uniref:Uncharacterized protein n=1 Tax=Rhipicephalus microplus TaxID=6941 RepID=A0A9J6D2R4_RHIMP|nr:hypothetical protein HPB51_026583 [Rhipicephalus microplus]